MIWGETATFDVLEYRLVFIIIIIIINKQNSLLTLFIHDDDVVVVPLRTFTDTKMARSNKNIQHQKNNNSTA